MAETISAEVDRTVSRTATRLPAVLTCRFGGGGRACACGAERPCTHRQQHRCKLLFPPGPSLRHSHACHTQQTGKASSQTERAAQCKATRSMREHGPLGYLTALSR